MKIQQIYTGCLAQGAYYIESNGEAAVIDPLREIDQYLNLAKERNAVIKYIFETHFHADFVSGHIDLSKKTGAPIVYGPTQVEMGFDAIIGNDGQVFNLGAAKLKLIHTPGHTLESSSYLLIDEAGKEQALFTGDTLFIGDVGRPDLAQHVIADLTEEKLAGLLYDSLRNKIMLLNDDIMIYPGHGAGSACGKNMSKETFDTLGHQKKVNYALRPELTKAEFIREVLAGLTSPPEYFPKNVLMNIKGYESIDDVIARGTTAISVDDFERRIRESDVLVLDTREPSKFKDGFIPGSWNIGLDGSFAVWAGTLIKDMRQRILLIAEDGREEEAVTRLARVGYDNCLGYLRGGFEAWQSRGLEIDIIPQVTASELATIREQKNVTILDIRKKSEFSSEHVLGAVNAPLDYIEESIRSINENDEYFAHCAGGYRSMIFTSILRAKGYQNLVNVEGGLTAIKKTDRYDLSEYVCPTTML
jgi:hydroxyacylglutathione hydrolase